ncbi:MAG: peptidoglycan-binding domain-containing protein [Chthoniobacteraceae bacterium]
MAQHRTVNRATFNRNVTAQNRTTNRATFNRNVTAQNRTANRAAFNRNAITQNRAANPAGFNRGNRNLALRNNTTNANANRFNTANTAAGNRVNANAAVASNRAANTNPRKSMASNQFAFRSGNFHRNWNPGRTYAWNHHHWRNFNGIWAVADVGWPYDWYAYPYPFAYDNTVYYDGDVYDPGAEAQPASVAEGPNNVVSNVQSTLANDGYNPGPVDGVPGPQTEQAIAQYQDDNGMPATGQIDSALLNSLGL